VIQDHARYRLRAPPRGYSWVRMGNGFALIQESTGQVFDVIPGR
jgi:Ni/Co efflux regulator RcnB